MKWFPSLKQNMKKNYSCIEFGLSFQQIIEMKKTFEPVRDDQRTLTKGKEKKHAPTFCCDRIKFNG